MVKKLSKCGKGFAVIIDKPILDRLNITSQTSLSITTKGKKIIIEPEKNRKSSAKIGNKAKLKRIYKKVIEKYAEDFKKLSEN